MKPSPLPRLVATLSGICLVGCLLFQTSGEVATAKSTGTDLLPGIVKDKPIDGFYVETEFGYMVPYRATMPGSDIEFEMVPIPGGRAKIGSPKSESDRSEHEGPQYEVDLPPFWMGKHEVSWSEYKLFMGLYEPLKRLQATRNQKAKLANDISQYASLKSLIESEVLEADAITVPTPLYEPEITFELGEEPRQPAATMSPYAAKQYTKWLSLSLGYDMRLPSEAEWEHASRAGTNTKYFFGDDPTSLGEYAWYYENADEVTHLIGEKKPNPWGLHDIYGNVAEWTLDEFTESGYDHASADEVNTLNEAIRWPKELFPRVARGGHYDDGPENCRSASRLASERAWRDVDPNLPKSPWWLTDYPAHGVGIRLLRPLKQMTAEQRTKSWEAVVDELKMDVEIRLEEGRGVKENVRKDLEKILDELDTMQGN